jgi:hypothetical protein
MRASVVIARGKDDLAATAILKSPPSNVAPTSCAQLIVRDGRGAIRMARLADAIELEGGSEFSVYATQQVLLDMVREQRGM